MCPSRRLIVSDMMIRDSFVYTLHTLFAAAVAVAATRYTCRVRCVRPTRPAGRTDGHADIRTNGRVGRTDGRTDEGTASPIGGGNRADDEDS